MSGLAEGRAPRTDTEQPMNRAERRAKGLGVKAQVPPWMRALEGSGRKHNKKARR